MKIFFSVGEPSGDLHAANLIHEIRRHRGDVEIVGFGGPRMAAAGCRLFADLTELAVMWILRALLNIHKFLGLLLEANRYFRDERPDAVVLIDYPGFNWWIARRAKAHGIPVFYYVPPQIWAWASWRVKKMRRFVDHVLCSLPFEEQWFRQRGCNAVYVGHPFFDDLQERRLDAPFIAEQQNRRGPLVLLLPGSRHQEVEDNLKWFLKAAGLVRGCVPGVRFAIASFKAEQAEMARQLVAATGLAVEVHCGRTPELIRASDCCMAVSGSVSLELLYETKPSVILYWISPLGLRVQAWFRHVRYITLVNLLNAADPFAPLVPANDKLRHDPQEGTLFPEYLTADDPSLALATHVVEWLTDHHKRETLVDKLSRLKARVAHGGASREAAEYILSHAGKSTTPVPAPHFGQTAPAEQQAPARVARR